jgi:hypothetical protein
MEHIGKIIKRVMDRWKHCKKCEIYYLEDCNCKIEKVIVKLKDNVIIQTKRKVVCLDYETNRFIFKGWLESTCNKCQSKLANLLDKENVEDNIKYCFDCKQRKVG